MVYYSDEEDMSAVSCSTMDMAYVSHDGAYCSTAIDGAASVTEAAADSIR